MDGTFAALTDDPPKLDELMPMIEWFVVILYERPSEHSTVAEEQWQLFTKKGRRIESIIPTSDALVQHTKSAVFQGSH